jgi:serine protease AprX
MIRVCLLLAYLLTIGHLRAQESRYMVFYNDKVGTTFSTTQPLQYLSQKAIDRRTQQSIAITEQDFPVNANYVSAIRGAGISVRYSSRWFNASLVEATPDDLTTLQAFNFVDRIEYVAPGAVGTTGGRVAEKSKFMDEPWQLSNGQLDMLGLREMHADGLNGTGVTIAVLDSGFPGVTSNPAFYDILPEDRLKDHYNFAYGYPHVFLGSDHGARVFSIIAASLNNFTGGAVKANFLLYTTEFASAEHRVEEYYWAFAAERADSAGADIINSSLGYTDFNDPAMDYSTSDLDGETAAVTKAAQMAFDRGIVVVVAAGNLGGTNNPWHYIAPPADGKDVLAVGAVDNSLKRASFSSFGPSSDNRIKPDVAALGVMTTHIASEGSLQFYNGTSFSCPLITSFVACLKQAYPALSAAELVDLVRRAGSQYFNPDFELGYGIPTYRAVKNIFSLPASQGIFVYPNPIQNNVLKLAYAPTDGSEVSYQIFNTLGQPLHEETYLGNWHSNPFEVDFTQVPTGVYLVKVNQGRVSKTFRVIKP